MKMPNGSGSVYKLSDTKRRRPWVASVSAGFNSKGRQIRQIIGYYATQPEARTALSEFQKHPTAKIDITLGALYKEWFDGHCRDLSRSTTQGYEAAWKYLRAINAMKVKDIRTGQVQKVIDEARQIRKDDKGNVTEHELSHSSLSKIRLLAGLLLDYAKKNDIVTTNYVEFVKLPRHEEGTRDAFTELEVAKVEKAAPALRGAEAVLVMCYTGFRVDEFLSLTTFSYNPTACTLTGGNKTQAGKNRVVPVHPKIKSIIEAWAKGQGEALFCWPDGRRYSTGYFRKNIFYPTLEALGIRKLEPHCTRHTFASMLHSAGVSTVDIQKLMGHSNYSVTADVYTHVDLDGLKRAVNRL